MDLINAMHTTKVLIADGATGTQLQKAGLPAGTAPEAWNLSHPEEIVRHHQSYLDAGSDIVLTNTFGGNTLKLSMTSLANKVIEINTAAAKLARQATGQGKFVFGDVGPTGKMLEPLGTTSIQEAEDAFAVQIDALAKAGVDAILIETMSALEEAQSAVRAAKRVCTLPIIVTMSFDTKGRTMMGVKPSQAVKVLWPLGLLAFGVNCGRTLTESFTAIQEIISTVPDAVLMAKPNAGLPRLEGDQSVYDVTPDVMAEYAQKFVDVGVKIFGGCCGSNPDHIRAIAKKIK